MSTSSPGTSATSPKPTAPNLAASVPAGIGKVVAGSYGSPGTTIQLSFVHTTPTTFILSDVVEVVSGSFEHKAVWDMFFQENPCTTEDELLKALVDVSRSNFGPNTKNWPGATVTITNGAIVKTVVLQPGLTSLKTFNKGVKGNNYTWTRVCLVSATLFQQVWRSSPEGKAATGSIAGNSNGNTQLMTLTNGWTQAHQNTCSASFDKFVSDNSLKVLEPTRKNLTSTAASRMLARVINGSIEMSWTFNMVLMYASNGSLFDEVRPTNTELPA